MRQSLLSQQAEKRFNSTVATFDLYFSVGGLMPGAVGVALGAAPVVFDPPPDGAAVVGALEL